VEITVDWHPANRMTAIACAALSQKKIRRLALGDNMAPLLPALAPHRWHCPPSCWKPPTSNAWRAASINVQHGRACLRIRSMHAGAPANGSLVVATILNLAQTLAG